MNRAFGIVEAALLVLVLAVAAWGVGLTLINRATAPAWLRPIEAVWT